MKKGEMTWELVVKLVLGVAFLLFVLLMVYLFREKLLALASRVADLLRFGA